MRTDLLNGTALAACLLASSLGALFVGGRFAGSTLVDSDPTLATIAAPAPAAPGLLSDLRGNRVQPGPYARIASLNPVADFLLLELVEPSRLVGVTRWSIDNHPDGWRFGSATPIDGGGQIEAVLALKPDLVVLSPFVDDARMQRLRESGLPVLDLGDLRGLETTLADIPQLAALVQEEERGRRLLARVQSQIDGLEARVADREHPWGMYVSVYGDGFFGGTKDTSYADLLRLAGVSDLAAQAGLTGWPSLSTEQILSMNPSLLVTQQGMAPVLCAHPAVGQTPACQPGGRVIELTGEYHSDPGLGLLQAAEDLQRKVHPQ